MQGSYWHNEMGNSISHSVKDSKINSMNSMYAKGHSGIVPVFFLSAVWFWSFTVGTSGDGAGCHFSAFTIRITWRVQAHPTVCVIKFCSLKGPPLSVSIPRITKCLSWDIQFFNLFNRDIPLYLNWSTLLVRNTYSIQSCWYLVLRPQIWLLLETSGWI